MATEKDSSPANQEEIDNENVQRRNSKANNSHLKWIILSVSAIVLVICGILFVKSLKNKASDVCHNNDLYPFQQADTRWGYININGDIIIKAQFNAAYFFHNGLALVEDTLGLFGFINSKGEYIIPAIYNYATKFSEGLAFVSKKYEAPKCINTKGETIFTLPDIDYIEHFSDGLAEVLINDGNDAWQEAFINKSGQIEFYSQFSGTYPCNDGMITIINEKEKFGFLNKNGEIIIQPQFDCANGFHDGIGVVEVKGKWGFIDRKGQWIIQPQFDWAYGFNNGLAAVNKSGKFGFIDKNGKIIIEPEFDEVDKFRESDICLVSVDYKYGYIDRKGHYIIEPQYDMATPFIHGAALVFNDEGYFFINKNGEIISHPEIKYIAGPDDDGCTAVKNEMRYLY